MPEPLAFLAGRFLPQREARLDLHDAGFVFGATVTEFCRTFHQRPYLLDRHLGRLQAGSEQLGIRLPMAPAELARTAEQLVAHNAALLGPGVELALIVFATPGPIGYYLGQAGGAGEAPATLGMHTFPLPLGRYARFFRDGVHLVTPAVRQLLGATIPPAIKHRSRLHWWLAEREVRRYAAGAVPLLLDERGHVTETALANFLLVRDGTVLTPLADAVLWGISIQVVEALCGRLGIPFAQQPLQVRDCLEAAEAMLCGSAFCLAGVRQINDHPLPWPGPTFARLLGAWSADVGVDIPGQILAAG